MNKFTIFTVIFAVAVIAVVGSMASQDYAGKQMQANVLEISPVIADEEEKKEEIKQIQPQAAEEKAETPVENVSQPYAPPPPASTITEQIIANAGFSGDFKEEHFDGKLFQLLDITKHPVDAISLYMISENGAPVASVTEIVLRDEIRALALYSLLQNKTKPYIDLSLNETNAYGDRSFYINHAKKPDEAFLTVKIGKTIYGFAYVKFYHPQIKKLIQLLTN